MNSVEAKTARVGESHDTGDGNLDAFADALLLKMAQFVGECIGDGTTDFCGFSYDEVRDPDGRLTSVKIVPCDMIDGDPIRREAKAKAETLKLVSQKSVAQQIMSGNFGLPNGRDG